MVIQNKLQKKKAKKKEANIVFSVTGQWILRKRCFHVN